MKKKLLLLAITSSLFVSAQKNYTKIGTSKISIERVGVSENFIKEYYKKCENKDYSQFTHFILDKRLERKFFEDYEKKCEEVNQSGKINAIKLNSVYIKDYTKNSDPVELIVFDADFEKSNDMKFVCVWIYRDQNVISGIRISNEKP